MNINDIHPYYSQNVSDWQLLCDIIDNGERKVKAAREIYLPFPVSLTDQDKNTVEFKNQYQIYLDGAYLVNFTQEAVSDLVNAVFSRDIIHSDLPQPLEYITVSDISKPLLKATATYGHVFLLADYPQSAVGATLKEQEDNAILAYSTIYLPLDVINWESIRRGGKNILTRVVIKESYVEDNEEKIRHRELLIKDGLYVINIWGENDQITETFEPMANGQRLTEIPGLFVGIDSNDMDMDQSPVLSIANTNLKHYQTTAELQHAIVYQGHPMLAITDAPPGFVESMNEDPTKPLKITVGASNAMVLEGSGKVDILQINPNLTHYEHLDVLKSSMIEQGARIKTSEKSGVESAEALRIRASSSNSTLASMAIQVEKATVEILGFMADFMATELPDDFIIEMNKQFIIEQTDPQIVDALSSLNNQGKLPIRILYDYLRDTRMLSVDEDNEVLMQEAEAEAPAMIDNALFADTTNN